MVDISRRHLAGLLAGAAAVKAIAAEHNADELPRDVITQVELSALLNLELAKDVISRDFLRRLEAGATVEDGELEVHLTGESLDELGPVTGYTIVSTDGVEVWAKPSSVTEVSA